MRVLAAHHDSLTAPNLLMIPGWAAQHAHWGPLLQLLRDRFNVYQPEWPPTVPAEQWIEDCLQELPERFAVLGWSLGGQMAIRLAHAASRRVRAVVTLASNPSFVVREDWPHAMPEQTFNGFESLCQKRPEKARQRFQLLQWQGDIDAAGGLRRWRECSDDQQAWSDEALNTGLQALRDHDLRSELQELSEQGVQVLHLLGRRDCLVPSAVADSLRELLPRQQVEVIDCCHVPFWSLPELEPALLPFLQRSCGLRPSSKVRNKSDVAESFSRAAALYDRSADLQRCMADRLLQILLSGERDNAPEPEQEQALLEVGCGTGYSQPALREHFPEASLVALDLAQGMLHATRQREGADCLPVCGDMEDLPLADASVDRVFSSLSIQWSDNPGALMRELARVTRPGGRILLSTLGPDSLQELRQAWSVVDKAAHVNRFTGLDELRRAIAAAGLQEVSFEEELRCRYFPGLRELTAELKGIGAHNVNPGRQRGLTGKGRIRALMDAYEQHRQAEGLPSTWQCWYWVLERPAGNENSDERGVF